MGLTPLTLWLACLLAVRNQRIADTFAERQEHDQRRAASGLPPRTRKRRRQTLAMLAALAHPEHAASRSAQHAVPPQSALAKPQSPPAPKTIQGRQ